MASPTHRALLYACKLVGHLAVGPLFRLRVEGRRNVPRRGPAVFCANHSSFLDPVALHAVTWRPIHFIMSAEFYEDRRLRWLYRAFEVIPIAAASTGSGALAKAGAVLDRGGAVGIFPEGRISRDGRLGPFRTGAAVLALRHGARLVPAWISGTYEALPRHARWIRPAGVRVRVGEPLEPGAAPGGHAVPPEAARALTRRLRQAVADLAPDPSLVAPCEDGDP